MGDAEVVEVLKIANRYLPRVRLEYDRARYDVELCKAELNSWKAARFEFIRISPIEI